MTVINPIQGIQGPQGIPGPAYTFKLSAYSVPGVAAPKAALRGPSNETNPTFVCATFTTTAVLGAKITVKVGGEIVAIVELVTGQTETVSFAVPIGFAWEWSSPAEAESSGTVTYATMG